MKIVIFNYNLHYPDKSDNATNVTTVKQFVKDLHDDKHPELMKLAIEHVANKTLEDAYQWLFNTFSYYYNTDAYSHKQLLKDMQAQHLEEIKLTEELKANEDLENEIIG